MEKNLEDMHRDNQVAFFLLLPPPGVGLPAAEGPLVRAELALGLCDRALRTTREVIKGHPNISEAYVLRGKALLFSADLDQAQKHLREALRLDPAYTPAQQNLKEAERLNRLIKD